MHRRCSSCWQPCTHKQESGRGGWIASTLNAGNSRSSEEEAQEGVGWEEKLQRRRHDVMGNPRQSGADFQTGVGHRVRRPRRRVLAHGAREEEVGEVM